MFKNSIIKTFFWTFCYKAIQKYEDTFPGKCVLIGT